MTDIAETLKTQLRKGYELGDGNLCLVASRDLETFIAEIERLRAALKAIADYPHNAPDLIRAVARIELDRALEPKP